MEHQSLDHLQTVARVRSQPAALSQRQRLQRWAEVLAADPMRLLDTLPGTEHCAREARNSLRRDNSPITLAARDPVLRAEGLRGDTYGEALRFFGLRDWQLHYILCDCHFGYRMLARQAAERVRRVTPREHGTGCLAWLRRVGGQVWGALTVWAA